MTTGPATFGCSPGTYGDNVLAMAFQNRAAVFFFMRLLYGAAGKNQFAAAVMKQAFGAFMEAGETGWAIKAGKEAASLYAQVGENRKALAICDKTAAYAKENHMAFELISIYELAASIAQDRGQAASYLELARGAVEEWIRRLQGPVSFYSPNPGLL